MPWGFAGAALGGLVDVGMGIFNRNSAKKAATKAYERQLYMSNTAHQREVKDLVKAGLNPVLSAGGNGAATVSVSPGTADMKNTTDYGRLGEEARKSTLLDSQKALIDQQKEQSAAQEAQALSTAAYNDAQTRLTSAKHLEQTSKNFWEIQKSSWFKELPGDLKYDVISSMIYPSNMIGQGRSLAGGAYHSVRNAAQATGKAIKSYSQRWLDSIQDAGSRAGSNSARKVKETFDKFKEMEERNRPLRKNQFHHFS